MEYPISIVCIVFNTEKWLKECLNSIYAQTIQNFELVVVNSGSDEATTKLLEEYIEKKENVNYIKSEKNIGGAAAGNLGIKAASGKYVILMDSDDVLPKTALENLLHTAQSNQCDVVIGRSKSIYKKKIINNKYQLDWITWTQEMVISDLKEAPFISTAPFYWGKLFRTEFLREHDIYMIENMINADRYFTCKALKYSRKTAVIHNSCYYWRRFVENSKQSITSNKADLKYFLDRYESTLQVESLFDEKEEKELYDYIRIVGLLRLFIPISNVSNNGEFGQKYCEVMNTYLRTFDIESLLNTPLLSSREKVYCYYLYHGMNKQLAYFVKHKRLALKWKKQGMEFYSYLCSPRLPKVVRIQQRFTVSKVIAKQDQVSYTKFHGQVPAWKKNAIELVRVYVMDQKKVEHAQFPVNHVVKQKCGSISFDFNIDMTAMEWKPEQQYYLSIEYITSGRVKRKRIRTSGMIHHTLLLTKNNENIQVVSLFTMMKDKFAKFLRGKKL